MGDFTLSADKICDLLGKDYEHSLVDLTYDVYNYSKLGISFLYGPNEEDDGFIDFEDKPEMSLQSVTLSAFDYHGINASSSFRDVTNALGIKQTLTIHSENYFEEYYFALRYIIGSLRFEFSSVNESCAGGLTLTISPSSGSQVFYISSKEGDSISKTLTIGDIKKFLKFAPKDLDSNIGNGYATGDEDTGGIIYTLNILASFLFMA